MPASPEVCDGVVVTHAADHVLRWIDAVQECPKSEEAPWEEKLQPDVLEVEVAQHAELVRGVVRPVRLCLEDGNHICVMDHDLHSEEAKNETDGVDRGTFRRNAVGLESQLAHVVVEGDNGSRKKKGRVRGICKVVAEGEILAFRRNGYTVSL